MSRIWCESKADSIVWMGEGCKCEMLLKLLFLMACFFMLFTYLQFSSRSIVTGIFYLGNNLIFNEKHEERSPLSGCLAAEARPSRHFASSGEGKKRPLFRSSEVQGCTSADNATRCGDFVGQCVSSLNEPPPLFMMSSCERQLFDNFRTAFKGKKRPFVGSSSCCQS